MKDISGRTALRPVMENRIFSRQDKGVTMKMKKWMLAAMIAVLLAILSGLRFDGRQQRVPGIR